MISFELTIFFSLMISIISMAFVESIAWINGKLLITHHASEAIEKIRQEEYGDS